MSARRRRKSDSDEHRGLLKSIPHYVLYPAAGFVVGLGSPIGAFLMRYWLADPLLKMHWLELVDTWKRLAENAERVASMMGISPPTVKTSRKERLSQGELPMADHPLYTTKHDRDRRRRCEGRLRRAQRRPLRRIHGICN